jgi:hypothetical protein
MWLSTAPWRPRYALLMRTAMLLIWSSAMAMVGCGSPQDGNGGNGAGDTAPGTREDPVVVSTSCKDDLPRDAYQLTSAELDGELLALSVGYGGGCRTHRFHACWDGRFAESFPVQTWISFHHDDGGDTCEAFITKTLYIDVAPILRAYQGSYGSSGPIVMHVRDTSATVTYQPPNAPAVLPL